MHPIKKLGFTVVELAIVMVVIGVILSFTTSFVTLLTEQNTLTDVNNKLEKIDKAIINFVRQNGRLPCPADLAVGKPDASYGTENDCSAGEDTPDTDDLGTTGTNEEILMGAVPTRSLGLSDFDGIDPWGYKIAYVAVTKLAQTPALYNAYETSDTDGVIRVMDSYESSPGVPAPNQIIQAPAACSGGDASKCPVVAYLLFSHGKNAKGAYSMLFTSSRLACSSTFPLEFENCDITTSPDNEFTIAPINDGDVANYYFDDIVLFRLKHQLDWELRK